MAIAAREYDAKPGIAGIGGWLAGLMRRQARSRVSSMTLDVYSASNHFDDEIQKTKRRFKLIGMRQIFPCGIPDNRIKLE
nr:hypothetical protein [uncultured Rhodopila sp.]